MTAIDRDIQRAQGELHDLDVELVALEERKREIIRQRQVVVARIMKLQLQQDRLNQRKD